MMGSAGANDPHAGGCHFDFMGPAGKTVAGRPPKPRHQGAQKQIVTGSLPITGQTRRSQPR